MAKILPFPLRPESRMVNCPTYRPIIEMPLYVLDKETGFGLDHSFILTGLPLYRQG